MGSSSHGLAISSRRAAACGRRADASGPWQLQFILAQHDGDDWLYRHDESIRLPFSEAILHDPDEVPYARPEIVLLSKSRLAREHDERDFEEALPLLDCASRRRLLDWLPAGHAWLARL
jgi:hypothetical protein